MKQDTSLDPGRPVTRLLRIREGPPLEIRAGLSLVTCHLLQNINQRKNILYSIILLVTGYWLLVTGHYSLSTGSASPTCSRPTAHQRVGEGIGNIEGLQRQ